MFGHPPPPPQITTFLVTPSNYSFWLFGHPPSNNTFLKLAKFRHLVITEVCGPSSVFQMLSIRLTFEKSSAFQIFDILFIHAVGGRAFEVSVAISNNLPLPSALLLTVHRYPNPQGLSFKISVQCVIRIRDGSWIYYQKMTHSGRWTHVLGRRKVLTSWVGFSPVLLCTGAKVLGIL